MTQLLIYWTKMENLEKHATDPNTARFLPTYTIAHITAHAGGAASALEALHAHLMTLHTP